MTIFCKLVFMDDFVLAYWIQKPDRGLSEAGTCQVMRTDINWNFYHFMGSRNFIIYLCDLTGLYCWSDDDGDVTSNYIIKIYQPHTNTFSNTQAHVKECLKNLYAVCVLKYHFSYKGRYLGIFVIQNCC